MLSKMMAREQCTVTASHRIFSVVQRVTRTQVTFQVNADNASILIIELLKKSVVAAPDRGHVFNTCWSSAYQTLACLRITRKPC